MKPFEEICVCLLGLVVALSSPVPDGTQVMKITDHNNSVFVMDILRQSKSAEMRNYMKEDAKPCDNFYEFACGNWAKVHQTSGEHLETNIFVQLQKAMERKITALLTAKGDVGETVYDRKVKGYFRSCLGARGVTNRTKLLAIIEEFGEMPVLSGDKWDETNFDWIETIARISRVYGKLIIFGISPMQDLKDRRAYRPWFVQGDLTLDSPSMYLDASLHSYRRYYKDIIGAYLERHLGVEQKLAEQTAREILAFEVDLATGMVDDKLGLSVEELANQTTVNALHKKYPTLDIKKLVQISLGRMVSGIVYEYQETYQQNLVKVIQRTSKKTLANYIFYALASNFFLASAKTDAKRAAVCLEQTKKYFYKIIDNMVYRKYNNIEVENELNVMWHEIKNSFNALLLSGKLSWMNEATRYYAAEKLEAMSFSVNSYANDNFTEQFGNVIIDENDYVYNMQSILKAQSELSLKSLYEPPKTLDVGSEISFTPVNVLLENAVKVPVAMLQPYYFWAKHYPSAVKYGTIGALIGHELIHGFDDTGRTFNKQGESFDWWDEQSTARFLKRKECFVEQYAAYKYFGQSMPKSEQQSENIADNGGTRLAYAAYLNWYDDAVDREVDMQREIFSTMNYTSRQLFFISYAQVWCNGVHPALREMQTATDSHSPGQLRVIGTLSNFPEFAKEFNCAAGTPMNPDVKCEIY